MTATNLISVEVPDIGDFADVPIIEILVSPGETVGVDDPLLTLESDKATMDVPAPLAGVIQELHVSVGDRVSRGTLLLTMEPASDGFGPQSAPPSAASAIASQRAPSKAAAAESVQSATRAETAAANGAPAQAARQPADGTGPVYASPAVRRLARELGVNLRSVGGSGRKGRITRDDVQAFAERGPAGAPAAAAPAAAPAGLGLGLDLAPRPTPEFEKFGPVERVQRSRIQRISAPNLARNWVTIPHVTHNDEADITELEAWRKRLNGEQPHADDAGAARSSEAGRRELDDSRATHSSEAGGRARGEREGKPAGVKFTMVSFLVVACVATLKAFPVFNSSLDGDELILKRYYNVGFAADTPGGLVVPVIKDADRKGLAEIASELAELSGKARDGKLAPGEMSGSTFTISSLGGIGGTSFTPIVNAPEVAILGVTRAAIKPTWNGEQFLPRLMLPLSLSYDHRVIDGAAAARFVVHLTRVLSDLRRALL